VSRPAVFLDRDGTLIRECGYLVRPDDLAVFPWSADAVRCLNRAGFAVVVITNQSAVARGMIDEPSVGEIHVRLDARLSPARIDGYYYCPHLPDAVDARYRVVCRCRKPGPLMIEQACRDLDLDPVRSWTVGDRALDVACGRAAATRSILVRTGHGASEEAHVRSEGAADAILNNLMEAVCWILRSSSRAHAR
jgi:D-glycero-D-manno-heptose 1,7-bisphosphate phosphatase